MKHFLTPFVVFHTLAPHIHERLDGLKITALPFASALQLRSGELNNLRSVERGFSVPSNRTIRRHKKRVAELNFGDTRTLEHPFELDGRKFTMHITYVADPLKLLRRFTLHDFPYAIGADGGGDAKGKGGKNLKFSFTANCLYGGFSALPFIIMTVLTPDSKGKMCSVDTEKYSLMGELNIVNFSFVGDPSPFSHIFTLLEFRAFIADINTNWTEVTGKRITPKLHCLVHHTLPFIVSYGYLTELGERSLESSHATLGELFRQRKSIKDIDDLYSTSLRSFLCKKACRLGLFY